MANRAAERKYSDWPTEERSSTAGASVLSITFALGGLALLVWALTSPSLRDSEGMLSGRFCLPFSLALSLVILAASARSGIWRWCGFWSAVSLAGQAVSLQMMDAGTRVHFQHYRPLWVLASEYPWHLAFLAAQIAGVLIGLRSSGPVVAGWLRRHYRPWALAALMVAIVFGGATLSRKPEEYVAELAFSAVVQLVNLGSILLAALSFPASATSRAGAWIDRVLGTADIVPLRRERLVLGAAVWVTCAAAFLAAFIYQKHPHLADEVTYLFHARYLAEGRLTIDPPPVPEAFALYLADNHNGRLFAAPPAAWPAALALGVKAGVPWLVNPLLGGLCVILTFLVARNAVGARYARLAVLLLAASPWFVLMCMNYMTHTLTLACALAAALGVIRAREANSAGWAFLAGLAIGYTSLIRPLDGLLLALILGLWSIGLGGTRLRTASIAAMAAGTALMGSLVLPYNHLLTGSATKFPLNQYVEKRFGPGANDLGFGRDKGLPFGEGMDAFPGHGLGDVIANGLLNTAALGTELHGWACGSLIVAWLLVFSGRMQGRDRWMLGAVIVTFLGFSTYWFSGGPDFGARYWYLMIVPLLLLTIGGIQHLERLTGHSVRVLATVLTLAAFSLVNYLPWRALDKYYHYLQMRPDIPQLAAQFQWTRDLILIRGRAHPDYSSAWIYNPLRWDDAVPVYASFKSGDLAAGLVRAFPDRRIWVLDGPTVSGTGYRVSGPWNAEQFLAGTRAP